MNILITPNIMINSLLPLNRQNTERNYSYFFERIMELVSQKQPEFQLYMTEIDLEMISIYINCLDKISKQLDEIEYFPIILEKRQLTEKILLIKKHLKSINKFPINHNIVDLASKYSGQINPSDAIRLAAAVSETFSESEIPIEAIVTWEPLHFCSRADDFSFARDNSYVEVFCGESEEYDEEDNIIKHTYRKTIYSPTKFINEQKKQYHKYKYKYKFDLVKLKVNTIMNINCQKNQVSVTIRCIENDSNKKYEETSTKKSTKGPISALFLSIYSCIGKIGRNNNLDFSNKNLDKDLVREVILALNPVKENNKEIFADVYLRNKNIQASESADNLMWATAKSYIEIIKSWLMEQD